MNYNTKIEEAAKQFIIAYCVYDDSQYTTSERKSISLKAYHANKRLYKILGFDMGNLPALTPEQMEIREDVYAKVKELKKDLVN